MTLTTTASDTWAIEALGLRKTYGPLEAVKGVNLQVRGGEIMGFLGPNGAGKTTTIKMLTGLLTPTAGTRASAATTSRPNPSRPSRASATCPIRPTCTASSTPGSSCVSWAVSIVCRPALPSKHRRGRTAQAVRPGRGRWRPAGRLQPRHAAEDGPGQPALIHNPQALFLDEPTVGLDPKSARLIKALLRARLPTAATPSSSPPTSWRLPTPCATAWPSSTRARSSRDRGTIRPVAPEASAARWRTSSSA